MQPEPELAYDPNYLEDAAPRPRTPAEDRRLGLSILGGTLLLVVILGIFWTPKIPLGFLLFLAIIVPMVLFHEWGHYWTAKKFGIAAKEFFIGFGPRIWSVRRGETEFGIKAFVPVGGYVKIVGMSQYEDVEPRFVGRTFRDAAPWKRAIVLVAGSATHFISALVLIFVLLVFVGHPTVSKSLQRVEKGMPAAAAGLRPGDVITEVDGEKVADWAGLQKALRSRPGETVTIEYRRDGKAASTTATLESVNEKGETIGRLGVAPGTDYVPVSPLEAVPETFSFFGGIVVGSVDAVATTFSPSNLSCIGKQMTSGACHTDYRFNSPVGVASVAQQTLEIGPFAFLMLLITINIFVGGINLVPLPPLDGGHLMVLFLEKVASVVRRRPVEIDQRFLVPVTVAVLGLLMMIFVSSLYLDVVNPVDLPK